MADCVLAVGLDLHPQVALGDTRGGDGDRYDELDCAGR